MSSNEPPQPRQPRRSRKSIAVMPSSSSSNAQTAEKDGSVAAAAAAAAAAATVAATTKAARKSRSKSLGPGGLDALNAGGRGLKDVSGNGRRASLAPALAVKSILKPTLPLSPPQPIPLHRTRASVPAFTVAPIVPAKTPSSSSSSSAAAAAASSNNTLNFNPPPATIPVRSEEDQQRRAEILNARAARRQSMGNRRVSFAPEATLHTWDVVEYYRGDGTPSSASGSNSTGRLSTIEATPTSSTAAPESPKLPDNTDAFAPETPLEKKGNGGVGFGSPGSSDFSSPFSSDAASSPFAGMPEASDSDSDSMSDGDASDRTFVTNVGDMTMGDMTMDVDVDGDEEATGGFGAFGKRKAWTLEGATEPVDQNEDGEGEGGEMTMEMTHAVGGLLSSAPVLYPTLPAHPSSDTEDDGGEMTMEMTRAVGGLLQPQAAMFANPYHEQQEDQTAAMDMTRPVGGILASAANLLHGARKNLGFITASPQKRQQKQQQDEAGDSDVDMDMTVAVGRILPNRYVSPEPQPTDMTMDMDMTVAVGGILSAPPAHRSVSPEQSEDGGEMDMTVAVGGILSAPAPVRSARFASPESSVDENEEMTMEFTSVLGGILGRQPSAPTEEKSTGKKRRSSLAKNGGAGRLMSADAWQKAQDAARGEEKDEDDEMEMSITVGGVEDDNEEEEEEGDMEGATMDVTAAIGRILPARAAKSPAQTPVKVQLPVKVEPAKVETPVKRRTSGRRTSTSAAVVSEPRVTRRSSAARRSLGGEIITQVPAPAEAMTPVQKLEAPVPKAETPVQKVPTPRQKATPKSHTKKATPKQMAETPKPVFVFATPQKKLATPLQPHTPPDQATPVVKPKTPSKFAPAIETPLRLVTPQHHGFSLSAKKALGFPTSPSPFKFAGTPKNSATSGIGIDKPGLGSPRIAAKLNERKNIGEATAPFSPIAAVPRELLRASQADDAADREEERKEREAEMERRKSLDLRSRIELLTPRKAGRKSLAYGALLQGHGKREREDDGGFLGGGKRRKSLEFGMTAKPLSLSPARVTRSMDLDQAPSLPSPRKQTPKKKSVAIAPTPVVSSPVQEESEEESFEEEEPKLTLQQFLSRTSISFLDGLTTTRRRPTGFPGLEMRRGRRNTEGESEAEASLTDCVIAGACTVPMLHLFQHSCRELKKYIKEGREVVKEIEADTLEENPLLFREYIDAPPDIKVIMDTQFKNVKTHARFLAKGIWYEWRMKLLEGVRAALEENLEGMKADEAVIEEAEKIAAEVMPGLKLRHEQAKKTAARLEEVKRKIESDDKEQLREARERLKSVEERIVEVKEKLEKRRREVNKVNASIEEQEKKKATLQECIEEAERVKEMNRGWSEDEVADWRNKVTALENKFGWSIVTVQGTSVELVFLKQLRVIWDATGAQHPRTEYLIPAIIKPSDPIPLQDAERDFFIACLNTRLSTPTPSRTLKTMLSEIDTFWRRCLATAEDIRKVRRMHPTILTPHGNGELKVTIKVLVPEIRSKVVIEVVVSQDMAVRSGAKVLYGGVNEAEVHEFVGGALKGVPEEGVWRGVVQSMVGRCLEGVRRGGVGVPTKT